MAVLGDIKAISLSLLDGVIGDLIPKEGNVYNLGTMDKPWENIWVYSINAYTIPADPKFTDTVTTVTTTGSGNAITAISATNGAITATKGSTFLTSHNTYTVSTTGSGNAVTAVSLSGTTFTVTKGATYSNNSGTVTKVTAGTGLSIGTTAQGNFTTTGTINHTNSVTAQTTQAVYPIKIDAQGHISAYGSAVTIPTVPSNIVNTITTTAGTHSAISSKTGAVSFNVPTKTSHLTNDSGFLTSSSTLDATKLSGTIPSSCYTNTTYGIATNTTNGLVKPWYTHTAASTGPTTGNNTTAVAVNAITTTASRYYAVEADNAGRLFVNVPWTNVNSSYLTGITSSQVTTALGYTPYNSTNPNGYTSNAGTITKIQTSAGAHTTVNVSSGAVSFNVPTTAAHVGAVPFLGNLTSIGSGTPAAATQTYWIDNVTNNSVSAAYNTSGAEYTLLFSRGGSNSYGSILKYGYTDTYLRILRRNAGNWSSTDWEKISAGYADSAGSVAWDNVTGKPTIPTVSYPVTSVNNKTGAVSLTASDVGALASSTTYVSTVTTTAGTHSAISSKSGAVSFNVPTKTSHLTNDSGFITSSHTSTYSLPLAASGTRGGVQIGYTQSGKNYPVQLSNEKMYVNVPWTDTNTEVSTLTLASGSTAGTSLAYGGKYTLTAGSKTVSFTMPTSDNTNTTYALSGALSSHKFTSTLTAGGSGSGTSTSDFTLAAGTGISITDTTSSRTMTIACTVSNTDTKVTQAYSSTNNSYPLLFSATSGVSSTSSRGDTTALLNNYLYYNPSTKYLTTSCLTVDAIDHTITQADYNSLISMLEEIT